jgi:alpha-glucosidase (family GH31 glycosyl hydrolase)
VIRPLWYEFPAAADAFSVQEQLMLGPALMVAPVLAAGAQHVDVTLPG